MKFKLTDTENVRTRVRVRRVPVKKQLIVVQGHRHVHRTKRHGQISRVFTLYNQCSHFSKGNPYGSAVCKGAQPLALLSMHNLSLGLLLVV